MGKTSSSDSTRPLKFSKNANDEVKKAGTGKWKINGEGIKSLLEKKTLLDTMIFDTLS